MKTRTVSTLLLIVTLVLLAVPISVSAGGSNQQVDEAWHTEYYNNAYVSGGLVGSAIPAGPLTMNWQNNAPMNGINTDNWYSRFTRTAYFPTAGTYTFEAKADDTVTVWVDGQVVTASASYYNPIVYHGEMALTVGYHTVVVQHHDITGDAYLSVNWHLVSSQSNSSNTIPPGAVSATVTSDVGLNFRSAPSLSATRLNQLSPGSVHVILGRNSDNTWAYLNYGGVNGWAYAQWLRFNGNFGSLPVVASASVGTPTTTVTGTVTATLGLNFRSAPSYAATSVNRLNYNTTHVILGRSTDYAWAYLNYGGVNGWADVQWLQFNGSFASLPVIGSSTPSTSTGTVVATAHPFYSVRIRACPSINCTRLGLVGWLRNVDIYGQSADGLWLKIRYVTTTGDLIFGWTYKVFYLDTNNQPLPNNLPVVQ